MVLVLASEASGGRRRRRWIAAALNQPEIGFFPPFLSFFLSFYFFSYVTYVLIPPAAIKMQKGPG